MTNLQTPDTQQIATLKQSLNASDQSIRLNAALDLAKLGDADSIPALIEGFQADNLVTRLFHAGEALTELGDVAVPALTAALDADHETVRVDAAYTLWKIDSTRINELLPVAIETLRSWDPTLTMDEQMRTPLLDAAILIGEMGVNASEAIPVLTTMLQTPIRCDDPQAWVGDPRPFLALLMTQVADSSDQVVDALIEALVAPDASLRWGAARALGELGFATTQAVPALTSRLTDEQEVEAVRVEAAYSLAVMGDPVEETLPALIQAVGSQDWWVRAFVARILGEMGSPLEHVEDAEETDWLDRAFYAQRTVRRVAQPEMHIVPVLARAMADRDYNVRRNAVYALSLIGARATEAIPLLMKAMRSRDVGPLAAEAIAQVGEASLPALLQALDEGDDLTRRRAAYALHLIDTPDAQDAVNLARKRGVEPLQPAYHHFYLPCVVSFDAAKEGAFEALYAETIARGPGSEVVYTLPYPKHEFLHYLVAYKGLLMHGSGVPDLEVLRPLRESTDASEQGNVSGIYADKGYMRPIYFAVVHRDRCFGLHSGLFNLDEDGTVVFDQDQGLARRYYKLTIGITGLRRNPWRDGAVYALSPDTFEYWDSKYWSEWTSRTPVQPVLRLAVTPDDLPLKDDLWGTDFRMIAYGTWVEPKEDAFPFLKDVRATPFHPSGQPPWVRQMEGQSNS
ncbi:HEAT repeat domain-containing protein [Chloroflexi bacterium TSY]|nr:HEAT repeat domain-containing protein [Chloroflexi bacterium TSY]